MSGPAHSISEEWGFKKAAEVSDISKCWIHLIDDNFLTTLVFIASHTSTQRSAWFTFDSHLIHVWFPLDSCMTKCLIHVWFTFDSSVLHRDLVTSQRNPALTTTPSRNFFSTFLPQARRVPGKMPRGLPGSSPTQATLGRKDTAANQVRPYVLPEIRPFFVFFCGGGHPLRLRRWTYRPSGMRFKGLDKVSVENPFHSLFVPYCSWITVTQVALNFYQYLAVYTIYDMTSGIYFSVFTVGIIR